MSNPHLLLSPKEFCQVFDACDAGRLFAEKHKTMHDVWRHCPDPRWMLWICARLQLKLDQKALRLFACYCVRRTPVGRNRVCWDLLKDERSKNAVRVAERFAKGLATAKELAEARTYAAAAAAAAAYAAYAAYAADAAAAYAADAADAAYAAAAADAAADAAYAADAAAAAYAADAAYAAAAAAARLFQANRLRKVIPNPFPAGEGE